jgi:hypothetical protein
MPAHSAAIGWRGAVEAVGDPDGVIARPPFFGSGIVAHGVNYIEK